MCRKKKCISDDRSISLSRYPFSYWICVMLYSFSACYKFSLAIILLSTERERKVHQGRQTQACKHKNIEQIHTHSHTNTCLTSLSSSSLFSTHFRFFWLHFHFSLLLVLFERVRDVCLRLFACLCVYSTCM